MSKLPLLRDILTDNGHINPWSIKYDNARTVWRNYRFEQGFTTDAQFTQSGTSNTKIAKSARPTVGLTLYPWTGSGVVNVCENATCQCRENCVLITAGKGRLPSVARARIARTRFLAEYPEHAVTLMAHEIQQAARRANGQVLVRLNVASDLPWEHISPDLFTIPNTQFYDYTKLGWRPISPNYRLVYSLSEAPHSERQALLWLGNGRNVAVVFDTKRGRPLPATWHGYEVVDGDLHDDRTIDPMGVVVGLRAKGSARKLEPGKFVQAGIAS